jgi:Hint domain
MAGNFEHMEYERMSVRMQRTRRNMLKMGAILAPVALVGIKRAHAAPACAVGCNCFLKGTKIQTADGERKVEDLAIGDMLPTVFSGMAPIQWIARYPLKKSDPLRPWVRDAMPVRIARSALAPGVPQADLYLTGNHALFIDGLLIAVGNLINGMTITRHEASEYDELEFFNIKLERYDVIYAEGAPVETLLDVDERAVNFAEYFRRYGTPKTPDAPCAPRVSHGGGRGELKSRLRSAISPWLDRREPVDVIRDRLEERGLALSRQLEPVP